MSYQTHIKHDSAGRLIASYRAPADEAPPKGEGWQRVAAGEGAALLLRSNALRRHYVSHGKIARKHRITLRSSGRAPVNGTATVKIEGLPAGFPSIRLLVAGKLVEVPAGQDLNVTWDTATQVTVRVDPEQPEFEGRAVQILFE